MKAKRLISILLALAVVLSLGITFVSAADTSISVTKSLTWDQSEEEGDDGEPKRNHATITVTSTVPVLHDTEVLFIGTLCNAHDMTTSTLQTSINQIAQNANVTYYLLDKDGSGDYNARTEDGVLYAGKTVARYGEVDLPDNLVNSSGNHASLKGFMNVLIDELVENKSGKTYDYVVLEFDSSRIADGVDTSLLTTKYTGTNSTYSGKKTIADLVAEVMAPYYTNDKVIWITDGYFQGKNDVAYTPTNEYYTQGTSTTNHLTAERFRLLCALFAPKYYQTNTTADSTYYGNGSTTTTLSSEYSLELGARTVEDLLNGKLQTEGTYAGKYMAYPNTARQLDYGDAGELGDFLYMAIGGTDVNFYDQIKTADNIQVKSVNLAAYQTTSTTIPALSTLTDSDWTTFSSLTVGDSSNLTGGEAGLGTHYEQSTDSIITVTTGNDDQTKDNLVTVDAKNMRSKVKYIKLTIELYDDKGFESCIYSKEEDGETKYYMDPNNGEAEVTASMTTTSGTITVTGTAATANPVEVTFYDATGTVTGGTVTYDTTKAHSGSVSKDGTTATADTEEGGEAVLTFTPTAGYVLQSIKLDGGATAISLTDGSYTDTTTGEKVTVTANEDGTVTVSFPEIAKDRSAAVVYVQPRIVKTVKTPDTTKSVVAGDTVVYTISVYNDGIQDISGVTVSDEIDTSLVDFVSASNSGALGEDLKTVTWSNVAVTAGSHTDLTLTVKAKSTITAVSTLKNTATGTYGGAALPTTSAEDITITPGNLTVEYKYVGTAPSSATNVASLKNENVAYGSTYKAEAAPSVAGYTFTGWCTDEACQTPYTAKALTDDMTLYGKWEYKVSLEKSVASTATPVRGGDTLTYTIAVKNGSELPVTGVNVTDTLNANLTYVANSATIDGTTGGTYSETDKFLAWNNLTIPANGTVTLTYQATVSGTLDAETTDIVNTAKGTHGDESFEDSVTVTAKPKLLTVEYEYVNTAPSAAPDTADMKDDDVAYGSTYKAEAAPSVAGYTFTGWCTDEACQIPYTAKALTDDMTLYGKWEYKVSLEKSVASTATPVRGGDTLTYTIAVKNGSELPVTGVNVTDTLNANLTYVANSATIDGTTGGTYSETDKFLAWNNLTIPANGTVTLTYQATVSGTLDAETTDIVNTAKGAHGDESFEDSVTVTAKPKLLTVDYKYTGEVPAGAAGQLPAANSAVEYGSTYTAEALPGVSGYIFTGWCTDEACTTGYTATQLTENKTLYGKWEYAVSMTKAVDPAENLRGGDTVTYTVTVSNTSNTKVTGVTVTDVLDSNLTYVDGTAKVGDTVSGTYDAGSRKLTWSELDLDPNSSVALTYQATISSTLTATDGTAIPNTAHAVHGTGDAKKEFDSNTVTINPKPMLLKVDYQYIGTVPTGAADQLPAANNAVDYGSTYTAEATPTLTGYTFHGWYSDKACTVPYTAAALTADKTLYGNWTSVKDFRIVKSVTYNGQTITGPVAPGSTVLYTIEVTNNNAVAAITDVVITDTVAEGLTITDVSPNADVTGQTITWTLSFTPGETKKLTFNATVPGDLKVEKSYTNFATVVSAEGETVNKVSNEVTFTEKPEDIAIGVVKTWSDTWASHKTDTVSVRLYQNNIAYGDIINLTAENPSWSGKVPPYDSEGNQYDYAFKEITADTVFNEGDMNGRYKVSYEVKDNTTYISNDYVIDATDLDLQKSATGIAAPGETFNYVLTIKNTRTYESADVIVTDTIPEGLTIVETGIAAEVDTTAEHNGAEVDGSTITWTIQGLAGGATAKLTIPVTVPADAVAVEYENIAYISEVGETTYGEKEYPSPKAITDVRTFTAKKTWSNPEAAHDAVTVQLLQNGADYGEAQSLSKENSWTYTWEKLPLYDESLNKYVYTVKEVAVEGYTTVTSYSGAADGNTGAEITNTLKTIDISYKLQGDDQPAGVSAPESDTVDYGTPYNGADPLDAKYYTFSGWYLEEDCQTLYTDGTVLNDTTAPGGSLVLYGLWTRKTADIDVKKGNPDGPDDSEVAYPEKQTIKQGETIETPADPTYTGDDYNFKGWYTDPDCTIPFEPTVAEGDVTIYALWVERPKVTYTFVGFIPEGSATPADEKLDKGTAYTSKAPVGTPLHFTFEGWYLDPECETPYVDGTSILKDTKLYGYWIPDPTVNYVYTGTVPTGQVAPESATVVYGTAYTAATKPSYEGYTFAGWYTDSKCTVPYVDGTVLKEDVTLYGKWTVNEVVATGDTTNVVLWAGMFLVSAAGMAALPILRKKKAH